MDINKTYNEDCRDTITRMPDNFLDMVVTSPPYGELREYDKCVWNLDLSLEIITKLYRVMKEGATVVWITADQALQGDESGDSATQSLYFKKCGFKLFDTMIYLKPPLTRGSIYAYHQTWEYMYVLTKGNKSNHGELIRDRRNKEAKKGTTSSRRKDGSKRKESVEYGQYGKRTNVWKYNTGYNKSAAEKIAFEHPAIYPEPLAGDHIKSWSDEGDLVYDPFMGSGTTAKMALKLGRNYIGSEISSKYCENIKKRLAMNVFENTGLIW